jgi:HEAT repeat protein
MSILLIIWWSCLALAAVSVLAMAGLILQRSAWNRRDRRDAARRDQLKTIAWQLMEDPDRFLELQNDLRAEDRRLLLQLFADLLKKVTGKYAQRFVRVMRMMGIVEECTTRLKDRQWTIRAESCAILSVFGDPAVRMALYRALDDPIMEVRVEAARALVRLGAVRSVMELIHYLVTEDTLPSLAVVDLFRNLGSGAVTELLELLRGDTTEAAKVLVIDALGHCNDLQAVPALLEFYAHPSRNVRLGSLLSLGLLRDPRAAPAVLLAMTDSDWEVRTQAAITAGQIGMYEAVPMLEKMLEDDHWWVRYRAAEALYRVGGRGIEALHAAATRAHPFAAEIAWGVLREKGLAA